MSIPHQKHPPLKRPNYGRFHRNEYAIIGTPCGEIQRLARQLTQALSSSYRVAYVDADHAHADDEPQPINDTILGLGGHLEYTDKIRFHRFDTLQELQPFQFRQRLHSADVVLVNGNHFKAKQQIVVIDPRKEKSLAKKLDRLTDVCLILLQEQAKDIPDYIKQHLPHYEQIPTFAFAKHVSVTEYILRDLQKARPVLKGLVLAGGKSQRMGEDKGALSYHGKPQREYAADLLQPFCEQVYISTRPQQSIESKYTCLVDSFVGLGPFGAILSAFRREPDTAWLVVACDLPFVDATTLAYLVQHRNASRVATAFHNSETGFPEPLVTIWEPRSYPSLLQFLAQGYGCPRKVLINTEIEELKLEDESVLKNVNTKKEREATLQTLQGDKLKK
ncbi:MAG: NTP transferase domain-containing protein [Bacteroidota bacterium]